MEAKELWKRARAATWREIWEYMGKGLGVAMTGGGFLLGAIAAHVLVDAGPMIGGLVGAALVAINLLIFNVSRVEVNHWKERAEKAEATPAQHPNAITFVGDGPAPERDWSIENLFAHLRPDYLESENGRGVWKTVGEQIRQAIEDNKLRIYGRVCGDRGYIETAHSERPPLKLIPRQLWANASFTYTFFAPNSDNDVHVIAIDGTKKLYFCDAHVNSGEARLAFKTNNPDPTSGRWENGWFVYNEPRQVFSGQFEHDRQPMDHHFYIEGISPNALMRYSLDLHPSLTTWTIWIGQDRDAEARKMPNVMHDQTARLDDERRIWFFANPTLSPEVVNIRVLIHSWRRTDDGPKEDPATF